MTGFEGYHGNEEDLYPKQGGQEKYYKNEAERMPDPDSTDPYRELFNEEVGPDELERADDKQSESFFKRPKWFNRGKNSN